MGVQDSWCAAKLFNAHVEMGQERPFPPVCAMSALPPIPTGIATYGALAKCQATKVRRGNIAPYSITSSAIDIKLSEIFRPSALAVFRLIAVSNLTGSDTGISAGFAPLRTLPA
jgi:hypothetical protein